MNTVNPADELRKQGLYFEYPAEPTSATTPTTEHDSPSPSAPPTIRPRTAQACDKCRERKTKCSGEKPACVRCQGRGLLCHYSARAHRGTRTRTVSPPQQKRRERVHTVDPPVDRTEIPVAPQQSVANSANAYKPYPYPQPSKSYSPRFQNSILDPSQSSYHSELENALREASPIAQSLPLTSGFGFRKAGPGSPGHNQYSDREARGTSRDSMADPNAQWWDTSYGATKSLSSNAPHGGGRIDGIALGGTKLDPVPIAPRPSYATSAAALNDSLAGPASASFYDTRGQYVAGHGPTPQQEQELRTPTMGSYDASYSTHGFLDLPSSYPGGVSLETSTSWDSANLAHHPAPQHPQQAYHSSQHQHRTTFAYHNPVGVLEDRRYSEYY